MIDRAEFLNLIHAAYVAGRYDFSRHIAADWLASWSADVEVKLLLAEAEMKEERLDQAIEKLSMIIDIDPELTEAYELLASAYYQVGDLNHAHVYDACRALLQREKLGKGRVPSWIRSLDRAYRAIDKGKKNKALKETRMALEADPDLALPTLMATKAHLAAGEQEEALSMASSGHRRWPECLFFRILLAEEMIDRGDLQQGVEMVHKVAADDPTGRLAKKYLGEEHPYQRLWPHRMRAHLNRPIPADVRAIFGGNRIESQTSGHETTPTTVSAPEFSQVSARPSKDSGQDHSDSDEVQQSFQSKSSFNRESAQPREVDFDKTGLSPSEYAAHMPRQASIENEHDHTPDAEEPDFLKEVEHEFEQIARRLHIRQPKSREGVQNPVYVILSCMQPLISQFGKSKFDRLDEAVRSLAASIQSKPGWNALWLYVDDPDSMAAFQLTPADPHNSWQIKHRITDLDRKLREQDEMIGALFILGGDAILPFHMLPNPTDDEDDVIPSDNPYATTDANYFAPEWPVGRLPSDDDVDVLVSYLRAAAEDHRSRGNVTQPFNQFLHWLLHILSRLFRRKSDSLGYTADIWRKASLAVFRAIGTPGSLITSPPVQTGALPAEMINPVALSYYNLHGLEDAAEWFGQRDPFEERGDFSPEFPVALSPDDIVNSGRAPKVVFTEACYGANVLGKTAESALCLKFLDSGSRALVGSTKISYGSVNPPLIAADLLGRYFWDSYVDGFPVGEALRRAKLNLASEMHRRQGYLDGEDQKTLISFVLFGDPLWTANESINPAAGKGIRRKSTRPVKMKTACALGGPRLDPEEIEPIMMSKVRSIVEDYLPGMADAICNINPQHQSCTGVDHVCPTHQLKLQKEISADQPTVVVSLSKHISVGENRHPHYARLTLDKQGKVLKLAVSR